MSSSAIEISLFGRTYSIACPTGQEAALRAVAKKLEQQLESLRQRRPNLTREEIAIMAALNIGNELYQEQQQNHNYRNEMDHRIRLLQTTLEDALVKQSVKVD